MKIKKNKAKSKKLQWQEDGGVKKTLVKIINNLDLKHVNHARIFCYKTQGSKARAYARIWSFPKIFQKVLGVAPAYVIEVLSERFDKLSSEQKTKVLIHELLHIPKNFSGSLLPHKYGHTRIDREVDRLYRNLVENI